MRVTGVVVHKKVLAGFFQESGIHRQAAQTDVFEPRNYASDPKKRLLKSVATIAKMRKISL